MRTVSMQEAKTHLARLVQAAANGEPFIITWAGKPLVKVVAVETPDDGTVSRIGFLAGRFSVPPDFDLMGADETETLFEGEHDGDRESK